MERLWMPADLRGRRLSPGRPERDLPALRIGDLYPFNRAKGRMQSNRVYVAGKCDDVVIDVSSVTKAAEEIPR